MKCRMYVKTTTCHMFHQSASEIIGQCRTKGKYKRKGYLVIKEKRYGDPCTQP
ncbi:hypothetical protein AMTR_s00030p00199920 [Amborella trichopoda]|uniref:Uncharacterized protein n=1 Tax=Amborella trichopoda TaxID=13333 RepID=U5D6Z9_AMBTC|nr:hypothetical protein AMTR_s00030p00199920 [Amborella trichopoda]